MTINGLMLTDLDGTLLSSDRTISNLNMEIFSLLEEKSIIRVAATGRSIYSAKRVLAPDFPIDYLIFSTGAGIMNWKTGEVIHANALTAGDIHSAAEFFLEHDIDFSIHHPIPDTHCFHSFASTSPSKDFLERLGLFKNFAQTGNYLDIESATQLLAVSENCENTIAELRNKFKNLNIIRTTSPLNASVVWIEVFPGGVSKGHAAEWLCKYLQISPDSTMSIGNDYNDLAMLEWTRHSYIVANAASELIPQFTPVPANDEGGFHIAVYDWLKRLDP